MSQERSRLLSADFLATIRPAGPLETARAHYQAAPASTEIDRLLYLDLKITIGDNDLFKVARTAELAGIGVRFPMLDHPLAEMTGALPASFKVRGGEKRYIFKRAFAELLPVEIIQKVKHGFGLPVSHWLKTHPGFRSSRATPSCRLVAAAADTTLPERWSLCSGSTRPILLHSTATSSGRC